MSDRRPRHSGAHYKRKREEKHAREEAIIKKTPKLDERYFKKSK